MKNIKNNWLLGLILWAAVVSAQNQYIIYSQNASGTGYSNIIRYDTTTGETFFVTSFSITDSGSILSISASGSLIYFTRSSIPNGRPNPAIWRISIDGSGLTDFLSPDTAISYKHVAVSPDGTMIAYTANSTQNPSIFQLYICNSDGTNVRRLTFDITWDCSYPVFISSDTILFKVKKDFLENYYTVNTSGVFNNLTNNENLSPYFPRLGRPMINYNRDTIIYGKQIQDASGYKKWAIFQLSPLNGTGTEVLLTDSIYFTQPNPLLQEEPYPCFYGTNTTEILFCGSLSGNVYSLYSVNIPIINPYLNAITQPTYHITLPFFTIVPEIPQRFAYIQNGYVYVRNETGNEVRVTQNSDNKHTSINTRGTMIAFACSTGIYTVRPDGTGLVQIESVTTADYPEFSPDGLWLLYVKNGDIYAKRVNGSGSSTRLTYTGNVAGDIRFSPTGQEIVFTGFVNSKRQIFICPVQISYDEPMTIVAGNPRNITPLTQENYQPSFSPDGSTIVFISTRNQVPELWLMNRDGSSQRKIMYSGSSPDNPASPCFSTSSSETIYYISRTPGRIYFAKISEQMAFETSIGIIAQQIQVSRIPSGTIEGERITGIKERDPYIPFTYYLFMHVDKIPIPSSVVLTEVIPSGWELVDVKINGITPTQMTSNGVTTGQLKWVFGPAGIAPVQDTVLKLTIVSQNPSSETYGEFRSFSGWTQLNETKTFTRGNSSFVIANPFIPVDKDSDWSISDEELLYTIYLWSINARISLWPEDLSEWDFLLLSVISFWANPAGYTYNLTDSRSQGKYLWKKL